MNKDELAGKLHITLNGIDDTQLTHYKQLYKKKQT